MLESDTNTDVPACVSCQHCHVGFVNSLFRWQQFAKCLRTKSSSSGVDPVTGKIVKKTVIAFCENERLELFGDCGPKGRYWLPKHTRDVFRLLKKI
jgi:hypothetical protein